MPRTLVLDAQNNIVGVDRAAESGETTATLPSGRDAVPDDFDLGKYRLIDGVITRGYERTEAQERIVHVAGGERSLRRLVRQPVHVWAELRAVGNGSQRLTNYIERIDMLARALAAARVSSTRVHRALINTEAALDPLDWFMNHGQSNWAAADMRSNFYTTGSSGNANLRATISVDPDDYSNALAQLLSEE